MNARILTRTLGSIMFPILIIVIVLIVVEMWLRSNGEVPGRINKTLEYISEDSAVLNRCYMVDSFGVMKFSEFARSSINYSIDQSITHGEFYQSDSVNAIYQAELESAYLPFEHDVPFFKWTKTLDSYSDPYHRSLYDYVHHPINEEGFRSISFKTQDTTKKKLLLIGDSFTYGYSSYPLVQSFYDHLLQSEKLIVYNTGITSTDPVQYLQIVKEYIPKLKPDYVIVNFFWGNDLMFYSRKPLPYQFQMYPVGGQMIAADPFGEYLSVKEACAVVNYSNRVANQDISLLNSWLAKTVLGTYFWKAMVNLKLMNRTDHHLTSLMQKHPMNECKPVENTREVVRQIFASVDSSETRLICCVFPDVFVTNTGNVQYKPAEVFGGYPYFVYDDNPKLYNDYPDGHLNNEGHRSYAEYILRWVDSFQAKNK